MKRIKRPWMLALVLAAICCLCFTPIAFPFVTRPLRQEQREEIYPGIIYYRKIHNAPRLMVAHIVRIDLSVADVSFLVTPPDRPKADLPLEARTTSQFLRGSGVQIAINGDGFTPWHSNGPLDFYPHPGDPIIPNGFTASRGKAYAPGNGHEPTLYISEKNEASFDKPIGKLYNAISGDRMVMIDSQVIEDLNDTRAAPRTAIGLDHSGGVMVIVIVDGRQPFYSEGATIFELAELLQLYGAETAMNLDGGGSTTLVFENEWGLPEVINSPIDQAIPGRQRPVGNHLGIFVNK